MKHRKIFPILPIVILLVIVIFSGTVIAYMFRMTDDADNQFAPAEVSCAVLEQFDGTNKSEVKVQNTGNIAAYLRIRLVSYWVDGSGNVVAKPSVMPSFVLQSGWVAGANNTYYYQTPVAPLGYTADLWSGTVTLALDGDYRQVLEVFAEAIQGNPKTAVTESWGVTLDSGGSITNAP